MPGDNTPEQQRHVGSGIALGVAVGVAIGVALGNLALGIGVGIALGVGWGAAMARKNAPRPDVDGSVDDAGDR